MPKVKYRYFRHRFDAHKDPKLIRLIEIGGYESYGLWWKVIEIYGENVFEKDDPSSCEIYKSVLLNSLNKRINGLVNMLTLMEQCDLLSYRINDLLITLSIPNFPKYFGHYGGLESANRRITCTSHKSEVISHKKKKKKKKKAVASSGKSDRCLEILEYWNAMSKENGLPCVKALSETRRRNLNKHLKEISNLTDWENLISMVPKKDFNLGENDRGWKANFDWLVRPTKNTPLELLEAYEAVREAEIQEEIFFKRIYKKGEQSES